MNEKNYVFVEKVLLDVIDVMLNFLLVYRSLSMVYLMIDKLVKVCIYLIKSVELGI